MPVGGVAAGKQPARRAGGLLAIDETVILLTLFLYHY